MDWVALIVGVFLGYSLGWHRGLLRLRYIPGRAMATKRPTSNRTMATKRPTDEEPEQEAPTIAPVETIEADLKKRYPGFTARQISAAAASIKRTGSTMVPAFERKVSAHSS